MKTKSISLKSNELKLTKGLAIGQINYLHKLLDVRQLRDVLVIITSILFFCGTLFFSIFS